MNEAARLERVPRTRGAAARRAEELRRQIWRHRKRYYADNNEDAVIMTTPPIQSEEYHRHFEILVRAHSARWGQSVRRVA